MRQIQACAEKTFKSGGTVRPMILAAYSSLATSRLRALAIVTLEEFPEARDDAGRRRLRLLAQEVLNNVYPTPGDPDHPMHARPRPRRKK